jgi:hypothetical protein
LGEVTEFNDLQLRESSGDEEAPCDQQGRENEYAESGIGSASRMPARSGCGRDLRSGSCRGQRSFSSRNNYAVTRQVRRSHRYLNRQFAGS